MAAAGLVDLTTDMPTSSCSSIPKNDSMPNSTGDGPTVMAAAAAAKSMIALMCTDDDEPEKAKLLEMGLAR